MALLLSTDYEFKGTTSTIKYTQTRVLFHGKDARNVLDLPLSADETWNLGMMSPRWELTRT